MRGEPRESAVPQTVQLRGRARVEAASAERVWREGARLHESGFVAESASDGNEDQRRRARAAGRQLSRKPEIQPRSSPAAGEPQQARRAPRASLRRPRAVDARRRIPTRLGAAAVALRLRLRPNPEQQQADAAADPFVKPRGRIVRRRRGPVAIRGAAGRGGGLVEPRWHDEHDVKTRIIWNRR